MGEGRRKLPPWSFRPDAELFARFKEAATLDRRNLTQAMEEAMELYCQKVEQERGKGEAAA